MVFIPHTSAETNPTQSTKWDKSYAINPHDPISIHRSPSNLALKREGSLIGVMNINTLPEHGHLVEMLDFIDSPRHSLTMDESSLESIAQVIGSNDARDPHINTTPRKSVTWHENCKPAAKFHQGCMPRGCNSNSMALRDARGRIGAALSDTAQRAGSFLQKVVDMTVGNMQMCGVGENGRANVTSIYSKIRGGEMCTRCRDTDGGMCTVNNGNYTHCQQYTDGDGQLLDEENDLVYHTTVGIPRAEILESSNVDFGGNHDVALLQETREVIEQSRDVIVASQNAILETRVQMLLSKEEFRESSTQMRQVLDGCRDTITSRNGRENCVYSDNRAGRVVPMPRSILKKRGEPNERDKTHTLSKTKQPAHLCDACDNVRSVSHYRNPTTQKRLHQKKKLMGRFVIRSLVRPIQVLTNGMRSNGPKRILAIKKN